MDFFFISGLAFYRYQWGCIWEEETTSLFYFFYFKSWLIKVCVFLFTAGVQTFLLAHTVWCMFGHNIVNKRMETQGSGKRSAYIAQPAYSDPRGATTSCEEGVLIECDGSIDNLKAAVFIMACLLTVRIHKRKFPPSSWAPTVRGIYIPYETAQLSYWWFVLPLI